MGDYSVDEGKVLGAAVIALLDSRLCTRKKDGRFKVRCGDGSKVMFSEEQFLDLNRKILSNSGADPGAVDEILEDLR